MMSILVSQLLLAKRSLVENGLYKIGQDKVNKVHFI